MMTEKTRAIVLHTTRYADDKMILSLLTREWGRVGVLVRSGRSIARGKDRLYSQPLVVAEMMLERKSDQHLYHIVESTIVHPLHELHSHPTKRMIALFLTEVIARISREGESDPEWFDYVESALEVLALSDTGFANFHLLFLLDATQLLGFSPHRESYAPGRCFSIALGEFVVPRPGMVGLMSLRISTCLYELLSSGYGSMGSVGMNRQEREELLEGLVDYFRCHNHALCTLKSWDILRMLT